jgi:hypothetical protein
MGKAEAFMLNPSPLWRFVGALRALISAIVAGMARESACM